MGFLKNKKPLAEASGFFSFLYCFFETSLNSLTEPYSPNIVKETTRTNPTINQGFVPTKTAQDDPPQTLISPRSKTSKQK
ncbi:MAG: hypothetical protein CO031_00720 [Candidatus Nealsonbacteria bacterium CG_4_9_14_0_2_um_filter_37_38]|nr:MAG: hypothetical protein CO031_00720 [Candidatus Nealsonbacteria bacterium CG_4_9_14_0_2_um_filter_37_38]